MAGNWSIEEKRRILEVYTTLSYSLKSYGDDKVKERLRSWEALLSDECTGEQICAAMIAHAKQSVEIPTPAELLRIINPPAPKITYADYKHALEQHALEGYPQFGYYGQVIKDYQRQQATENETPSYQQILEKRQKWLEENQNTPRLGAFGERIESENN